MLGIKRNTDWEVIYELLNIQIYLGVYEHEPVLGKKRKKTTFDWLLLFSILYKSSTRKALHSRL